MAGRMISRPLPKLAALTVTLIAAGCGSTPSSDDILARAADLNRRTQSAVTPPPAPAANLAATQAATLSAQGDAERVKAALAARQAMTARSTGDTAPMAAASERTGTLASTGTVASQNITISPDNGTGAAGMPMNDSLLPPNAKPGECFARVYVEPTYQTVTEPVVVREETSRIDIVPARFEEIEQQILVKPGDRRIETIPAKYEWVEERVLVTPESTRLVEVKAVTQQVQERVLVKAGYTTWKKGTGPIQKVDETTGEIMCLVEVPPVYDTVTKTIEVSGPQVREEIVPAVYRTVRKQVLVQPAQTREVEIPAEFKTVKARRLVDPAREFRIVIPAQMGQVERRELVTPGRVEWREILCDTNTTRAQIRSIQIALRDAGYDPGPIDGIIAARTMSAVNAYQQANNLPVDKYLNMATVRALGVMSK